MRLDHLSRWMSGPDYVSRNLKKTPPWAALLWDSYNFGNLT